MKVELLAGETVMVVAQVAEVHITDQAQVGLRHKEILVGLELVALLEV
jgi:hypothetical protein